jgi:hypothetical protein
MRKWATLRDRAVVVEARYRASRAEHDRLAPRPACGSPAELARLRSRGCDRTDWSGGVGHELALLFDAFWLVGSATS